MSLMQYSATVYNTFLELYHLLLKSGFIFKLMHFLSIKQSSFMKRANISFLPHPVTSTAKLE